MLVLCNLGMRTPSRVHIAQLAGYCASSGNAACPVLVTCQPATLDCASTAPRKHGLLDVGNRRRCLLLCASSAVEYTRTRRYDCMHSLSRDGPRGLMSGQCRSRRRPAQDLKGEKREEDMGLRERGLDAGESTSVLPGLRLMFRGWLASAPGRAAGPLPEAGSTKNFPGDIRLAASRDGVAASAASSAGGSRGCTSAAIVTSGSAKSAHSRQLVDGSTLALRPMQAGRCASLAGLSRSA